MKTLNFKDVNIKTLRKFFRVSVVTFCVCFIVQLYLSNRYAIKNDVLQNCLVDRSFLNKELAKLSYKDSLLSSLDRIESEAIQLGFVKMDQNLLVIGPVAVASLTSH